MSVHSAAEIDALWWRFYKSRDAISVRARMIVADKYDGAPPWDSVPEGWLAAMEQAEKELSQ